MNRALGWIAYVWLLAVEALEQVDDYIKWRFFGRGNPETRQLHL